MLYGPLFGIPFRQLDVFGNIFWRPVAFTRIDRGIFICYSAIKLILGARRQLELIEFKLSMGSIFIRIPTIR